MIRTIPPALCAGLACVTVCPQIARAEPVFGIPEFTLPGNPDGIAQGIASGDTDNDGDLTGDGIVSSADFNVLAGDLGCGS